MVVRFGGTITTLRWILAGTARRSPIPFMGPQAVPNYAREVELGSSHHDGLTYSGTNGTPAIPSRTLTAA
jgi:hypothetical protein